MDNAIDVEAVRNNLSAISSCMRDIVLNGTFEKFTDDEKDCFNRMKILLDNTRLSKWINLI